MIDSKISDKFEGWDDGKTYKLDDGSEWKLTSYKYAYKYAYRPNAKIWEDGSRYFLDVEDMDEKVEVRRV